MNIYKRNILLVATYCMGVVFILSAMLKIVALHVFTEELRLYLDIYFFGWLRERSLFLAVMVCLVEFIIGIGYVIPALRSTDNMLALFTLTFFVYLTGNNHFYQSSIGRIESCGCFGELIHFTPIGSFVKALLLWVMTIIMQYMKK